jgi:hypothetical protein
MLETVRDYARQKLSTRGVVETSALRDRHADFYAAEVERLCPDPIGPPSNETPEGIAAAFVWVDAEYHNIQSALAWWLGLRSASARHLARTSTQRSALGPRMRSGSLQAECATHLSRQRMKRN